MPTYVAPRSDAERLFFLKSTLNAGPQDTQAGNAYVDADTLTAIGTFTPRFESAYHIVNSRLAERIRETQGKTSSLADLETYVRDFWEVLKRMVTRRKLSLAVLAYYGLGQDGSVPKSATETSWLDFAAQIEKGAAEAVAAGYPAMSNPSAAEVVEALTRAQAELNQVSGFDRAYDQAQEDVAELRAQADAHIQEVMAQLRFTLRKKDEPSQRRIMRSYGAKFTYGPGETPDEDGSTPEPKPVELGA